MGYDVAYLPSSDDLTLIRMARAERRVILTRSRKLTMRGGTQALLICSQMLDEQIAQVKAQIGSPPEPRTSRCAICNVPLVPLSREAAQSRVPPYVWRTTEDFSACSVCHRVYWPGSHWQAIQERRKSLLGHQNNAAG
jgi:uncharacterized protein with PIN domain